VRRAAALILAALALALALSAAPAHAQHPLWKLLGSTGIATPRFARRIPRRAAARTYLTRLPLAPAAYAIFGYEAMAVVLDAIDRAADPASRAAVIAAFFATRDRDSPLGRYSIDAFGDTTPATFGGYRAAGGRIVWDRLLATGAP
jgi:hypothetical protein